MLKCWSTEEDMSSFNDGRIYIIKCHNTCAVYVGYNTTDQLRKQLQLRELAYKRWVKDKTRPYDSVYDVICGSNYTIECCESVSYKHFGDLLERCQYYIDTLQNVVNKKTMCATPIHLRKVGYESFEYY
jgi:hypothetical protein